jgi:O-antigen ligase
VQTPVNARSAHVGRWTAILLGVSIPVSTAVDSLLLAVLWLAWLLSGDWHGKWNRLCASPPALAVSGIVVLAALGMTWGLGTPADRFHYFAKYADLLLAPLLITLPMTAVDRRRALLALTATLALTLLLSYAFRLGITPQGWESERRTPTNPWVFKRHITHGLFMAFAFMIAAIYALKARSGTMRRISVWIAVLAAGGVLIVDSRTGYLVLAVTAAYLFIHRWRGRGLAAVLGAAALLSVVILHLPGAPSIELITMGVKEMRAWEYGRNDSTSLGLRMQYVTTTVEIIKDHPIIGTGTGGFPTAYSEKLEAFQSGLTSANPHNQYLLMTAQFGLLGLCAILALGIVLWRSSSWLAEPDRLLARGLVVAYAAGSLFNSFLLDHAERLLFAWLIGVLFSAVSATRGADAALNSSALPACESR